MRRFMLCAGVMMLGISALSAKAEMISYIEESLPAAAVNNILDSEKVFCYTVEWARSGYTGYTLGTLALTGYCGQLKEEKSIFVKEFFETSANISEATSSCKVSPKVMLRFIRGVDATDVLISDSCPSLTIFYGGVRKTFNAAPMKKSLEGVVSLFSEGRVDFVSPALLDELMPSGVVLNDEQRALLSQNKSTQPVRKWEQQKQPQSVEPAQGKVKVLNRLKDKE